MFYYTAAQFVSHAALHAGLRLARVPERICAKFRVRVQHDERRRLSKSHPTAFFRVDVVE